MPRALFSVSDKTGIVDFAKGIASIGWDIVATGRTADELRAAGVHVTPIEQVTGLPEMLGGRVKTLHPAVHAAILARDHSKDMAELTKFGFAPIDLIVCNLYPFQQTIVEPDVTVTQAIEQIDIGGVTLLRAAAKNFERVTVVVDPSDYDLVQTWLLEKGQVSLTERRRLAAKAFAMTRNYDTVIYGYLAGEQITGETPPDLKDSFTLGVSLAYPLRYGENPHQAAGLYVSQKLAGPLGGELLQGKELSYNNLLDADAAWRTVSAFEPAESAAVVIVKHMNPCGLAIANTLAEAFPPALASDPVAAFGGVIAVNRPVDEAFVLALETLFLEVIVAPSFAQGAYDLLAEGRKNCRLLTLPKFNNHPSLEFRSVLGGVLIQQCDVGDPDGTEWEVVTQRRPTNDEIAALKFAWVAVQHVRSNAIVLASKNATVGIGGGLPSRIDSVRLAVQKAGPNTVGAVMASDAFFPFPDGLQVALEAGVTAVIQPGGSIRDQQVIEAANAVGAAMIFTKVRHFRH